MITKDDYIFRVDFLLDKKLSYSSKILLTNDPKLIADGVQAIEDEFLEWFVKNPSCRFVYLGYSPNVGNLTTQITYKPILPDSDMQTNMRETPFTHINEIQTPSNEGKNLLNIILERYKNEKSDDWDIIEFINWMKRNNYKIVRED